MPSFPETDIELSAELSFGADLTADPDTWIFTDLSDRVIDTPITVTHGVLVGAGTTKTGSVTGLTLLNDDGHLTPYLATSPYYPYVDAGTPARIAVRTTPTPHIADTFTRTVASGWGTPDTGPAWTNTSGLSVSAGKGVISFSTNNLILRARSATPIRDAEITFTASISAAVTGDDVPAGPMLRDDASGLTGLWPTIVFGTAGVLKLRIMKMVAGIPSTIIGVLPSLAYSAGTAVSCRIRLIGDRLQGRIWLAADPEPSTWNLDETVEDFLDAGSHVHMGAYVPSGNSNSYPLTVSFDDVTVQQPKYARAEMYIADVQPSFRQLPDGTTHSVAVLKLGGVGTILEKRESPAWSPLRRSLQLSNTPPIAYWPCEDKAGATSAASGFEDQDPMTPTGPAVFSFDLGGTTDDNLVPRYGTSAIVSLAAGARLTGPVPASSSTAWTVTMEHQSYTASVGGGVTEMRLMEWQTPSGTHQRWALIGTTTGHKVRAYNDAAGTTTDVITYANIFNSLINYSVTGTQNGGNIDVGLLLNANPLASGSVTGTIGAPTRVTINPDQANTTGSTSAFGIRFLAGHVMVHNSVVVALPFYSDADTGFQPRADRAWAYEAAHRRAARLADEANVPFRILGDPYTTGVTLLNAQQEGGTAGLVQQAIDSESGGLLLEEEFGWLHVPRTGRYNQPVDLTVDMSTYAYSGDPEQVLVPQLETRAANRWTVQRTGGSSGIYAASQAYRQRRGTVDAQATLDVLLDSDCSVHASWRTHLSVDGQGANYPSAPVDLAANPDLIDDWLLCRVGSRIQRTGQPTIAGLDTIDQIADGITETIGRRSWSAVLDTSPGQVWQVGAYDGGFRYDSASTTLAADVTDSALVLGFSTANVGDLWTVTSAPFDVTAGGQTDTVLWMSNAGSIAPLEGGFETGITGWQAIGGAIAQSASFAHTGTQSATLTVSGSPGSAAISNITIWPVAASTAYTGVVWLYSVAGLSNVRMSISWYTSGGSFLSSSTGTTASIPAGVWTKFTASGTSPGTAANARVGPTLLSSPANGTVVYFDDIDLILDSASSSGTGPYVQNAWVVRDAVVVKALSAGEPIHVANPGRWAL